MSQSSAKPVAPAYEITGQMHAGFEDIRSGYMSGPFRGAAAVILSAFASRMPFGALEALFPHWSCCRRLYKLQLTFSRRVLILGHNR